MSLSVSIFTRCLSPFFYSSFHSYVEHTNMPSLSLSSILTLNFISNLTHARSHSHILCLSFVFSIISLHLPLSCLCLSTLSCLCLLYVSLCHLYVVPISPSVTSMNVVPISPSVVPISHSVTSMNVVPMSPSVTSMSQYLPLSSLCFLLYLSVVLSLSFPLFLTLNIQEMEAINNNNTNAIILLILGKCINFKVKIK